VFPCTINTGGAFNLSLLILAQHYGSSNNTFRLAIGADSDNYLLIIISRVSVQTITKINGVFSLPSTAISYLPITQAFDEIHISFGRVTESTILVSRWIPRATLPSVVPASNNFSFLAFASDDFSGADGIQNVIMYGNRIISI
jgi:hypothetical protein